MVAGAASLTQVGAAPVVLPAQLAPVILVGGEVGDFVKLPQPQLLSVRFLGAAVLGALNPVTGLPAV